MVMSEKQRMLIFWASFAALAAAGAGFALRVMSQIYWADQYTQIDTQVGEIFGLSLWPIAVTMILFSLIIDKVGYRAAMFIACALQIASVILTAQAADSLNTLKWACFLGGLGHGVIEACINPLCASIYPHKKTAMLNILHAAWPAGIIIGGSTFLLMNAQQTNWHTAFWIMLIPIAIYGIIFATIKAYPQDQRVEAHVSNKDMLKEFGALGAFLAITFVAYELISQVLHFQGITQGIVAEHKLATSTAIGLVGAALFYLKFNAIGKWLFFILCIIMIPLAATELGTDAWIRGLMEPVMGMENAGWAIVASAGIMMVLRFFAGIILKFISPPMLLFISSIFSMLGLYALSTSTGNMIFAAFVLYAIGQTFYWGTMLGFVAERFPKGGAMTINTVSAIGLLTIGIFGAPFLGYVKTSFETQTVQAYAIKENIPQIEKYITQEHFFFIDYDAVVTNKVKQDDALSPAQLTALTAEIDNSARQTLKIAALMPLFMAIAFGMIIIYFKSKGGYAPVELEDQKTQQT